MTWAGQGLIIQAMRFRLSSGTEVEKGATMVRVSAAWIITAVIVLFMVAGNAQPAGAIKPGEGQEAISWETYRQRQVEMQQQQLDVQRQRLEL